MVAILLLLICTEPTNTFRVSQSTVRVSEHGELFLREPVALTRHENRLFLIDMDQHLWCFDISGRVLYVTGGRGEGPGKLKFNFRSVTFKDDELAVMESSGHRQSFFTLDGAFVRAEKYERSRIYSREPNYVSISSKSLFHDALLTWVNPHGKVSVPLFETEEGDASFYGTVYIRFHGPYGLVYSTESLSETIYYAILHLDKGMIWDVGEIKIRDPLGHRKRNLPPGSTLKIVHGCTTSDTYGFVLTEYFRPGRERTLRLIDPETKKNTTMTVDTGDFGDLRFFQHIEGDSWVAFNGDELLFFTLEPR